MRQHRARVALEHASEQTTASNVSVSRNSSTVLSVSTIRNGLRQRPRCGPWQSKPARAHGGDLFDGRGEVGKVRPDAG